MRRRPVVLPSRSRIGEDTYRLYPAQGLARKWLVVCTHAIAVTCPGLVIRCTAAKTKVVRFYVVLWAQSSASLAHRAGQGPDEGEEPDGTHCFAAGTGWHDVEFELEGFGPGTLHSCNWKDLRIKKCLWRERDSAPRSWRGVKQGRAHEAQCEGLVITVAQWVGGSIETVDALLRASAEAANFPFTMVETILHELAGDCC